MRAWLNCLSILLLLLLHVAQVSANLLVAPTRIAFEPRDRTKQVILINQSDKPQTYRLEWVEQLQTQEGNYIPIQAPEEFNTASEIVRFSPRQVRLQAGERQVVKLLARKPADLANGEYRSHLKFTAIPSDLNDETNDNVQGIAMKVHLFLSYTIPVIVKQGETKVSASIDNVIKVDTEKGKRLKVTLSKQGSYGVSGDVVALQKNESGEEEVIARLNNVNLFHELNERTVTLQPVREGSINEGPISVRFDGKYEFLGMKLSEISTSI